MSIDRSPTAGLSAHRAFTSAALLSIIAGLGGLVAMVACRKEPAPAPAALRLSLDAGYSFGLALAPDGRRVAFPDATEDGTRLWLHDLTHDTRGPLEGTSDAMMPFWSPDGGAVAFFAEGKLRVFSFADRSVRDVADAPAPRGGAWHASGDIVFAPDDAGLKWRRTSGAIEPFTTLEAGESSHRFPRWTADGRHVIFFVRGSEGTRHGISMVSVDQPSSRRRLTSSDAEGLLIDQTLIYSSGGALVAQRMNVEELVLEGRPVLLGSSVGHGVEHQLYATAAADVLLFGTPASTLRELRWMDRSGVAGGVVGEPMDAWDVRLAPRGGAVAVTRIDPQLTTLDIWAYEGRRPLPRRLSPNIDVDEAPAWSPDAASLAWISSRRVVTIRDADGARSDVALRKFDNPVRVTDWSVGGWIVITETRRDTGRDIVLLRADGQGEVRGYAQSPFNETRGAVAPNGRWMAYESDEPGRTELYVDAFPTPGNRARLTVGGGAEPRWSRDGAELFFRRGSAIHAVRVRAAGATLEAVSSERLFDAGAEIRSFDVAPDGSRFLVNVPAAGADAKPMTVLVNVRALLP